MILLLAALSGCTTAEPTLNDLPVEGQAPVPTTTVLLNLEPEVMFADRPFVATVRNLQPGTFVSLYADASGAPGACPPAIAPTCLAIPYSAIRIGRARAGADGTARFNFRTPPTLGPVVKLQALSPGATVWQISNQRGGTLVDPTIDVDADGLTWEEEEAAGTSVTDPDTDGDLVLDGVDPDPLVPRRFAMMPGLLGLGDFQPPGVERELRDATGAQCLNNITVALTSDALCFAGWDGEMMCAGSLHGQTLGPNFVPVGLSNVTQILATNPARGDTICAVADGKPKCLGADNAYGQLGDGTTTPRTTWTQWAGTRPDIDWLVTHDFDTVCGMDVTGQVWCTGLGFGSTPIRPFPGTYTSIRIDRNDQVVVDVPEFRRQSATYECFTVDESIPRDLNDTECQYGDFGRTAAMVAVSKYEWYTTPSTTSFILEPSGEVTAHYMTFPFFTSGYLEEDEFFLDYNVLFIAGAVDAEGVCAVYIDGSMSCFGPNTTGRFGTGSYTELYGETQVLPPGSFDVECH
jgi:hypothetical protein